MSARIRNRSGRACDAANKTLGQLVPKDGFGEAPQQAFSQTRRVAKISSVATLEVLAKTCVPENPSQTEGRANYTSTVSLAFFSPSAVAAIMVNSLSSIVLRSTSM